MSYFKHKDDLTIPKGKEREFARILNRLLDRVNKGIAKKQLVKTEEIEKYIKTFSSTRSFNDWAEKTAKWLVNGLNVSQRGKWRNYFNEEMFPKHKHLTFEFRKSTKLHKDDLNKLIQSNFKYIKSVPQEILKSYKSVMGSKIVNQVINGAPRKDLYKFLVEKGAVRAKLIARTEIAKANSELTTLRARKVGSKAYIWDTSNDIRVRESHKQMNGVVVFFKDVPRLDDMVGHAGEYPNCRCLIHPIVFPELTLNKPFYKVYVEGKIKKWSKKHLLNML